MTSEMSDKSEPGKYIVARPGEAMDAQMREYYEQKKAAIGRTFGSGSSGMREHRVELPRLTAPMDVALYVVTDGLPGPESCKFVELETHDGRGQGPSTGIGWQEMGGSHGQLARLGPFVAKAVYDDLWDAFAKLKRIFDAGQNHGVGLMEVEAIWDDLQKRGYVSEGP